MINEIKKSIAELEARLATLRDQRDAHVKASGMAEEQAKLKLEVSELSLEIQADKEALAELQGQKAGVVSGVCGKIADAMSAILPEGRAVFEIRDETVFIGWERNGVIVPVQGLSGGQRAVFNPALAYVLAGEGEKIISIEGGEIDSSNMATMLDQIPKRIPSDCQVIISTCNSPNSVPDTWEVTILK